MQLNVLIVEDSEGDTKMILHELRRGGYQPNYTQVETSADMQDALESQPWDIIISDYMMPEFDGLSALSVAKETDLDIPFIIVSGSIGEDIAVKAMKMGAQDYLMKDNLPRLVPAIERELREAEIRRARRKADQALQQAYDQLELRVQERTAELAEANEKLLRALRVRDEFMSLAAHELKTPITSMNGFAQTLLRQFDKNITFEPSTIRRVLEMINQQSERMTQLITQLMDVSRIETGRFILNLKVIDLVELAKDVAEGIQLSSAAHEISVSGDPVVMACVDPLRIEQVLSNLMSNAVKFSPDGGRVSVEIVAADQNTARIVVTDQGIGIAPEHQSHIFERFYQAHETDYNQGMGIGLYISQQFVEHHGGQIAVESPNEGGTRFIVWLPLNLNGQ